MTEIEGYKLGTLTFEQSSKVFSRAQVRAMKKLGLAPDIASLSALSAPDIAERLLEELLSELRIQLLHACIQEPRLTEEQIRNLPSSLGRRLLDECIKLNPDFAGL